MKNECINDPAKQKIDWSMLTNIQQNYITSTEIDKDGLLEWAINTIGNAASDIIRDRDNVFGVLSLAVYIKGVTEVVKKEVFDISESN